MSTTFARSSFHKILVESGPVAMVASDSSGRIVEFNVEAELLFGAPAVQMLGESMAKLYWDHSAEDYKVQTQLAELGKVKGFEVFGRNQQTGEKIPLSIAAAFLRNESGEFVGSVGIFEDLRLSALRGRTGLLVDALGEISSEEDLEAIAKKVTRAAVTLLYADAGCLLFTEGSTVELGCILGSEIQGKDLQDRLSHVLTLDLRTVAFLSGTELDDTRLLSTSQSAVALPMHIDGRLIALLFVESREEKHFQSDQKLLDVLAAQAAVSINRSQLARYRERTQQGLLVSANAIAVGQIATTFLHEAKNSLHALSLSVDNLSVDIKGEAHLNARSKNDYLERLSSIQEELRRFDHLSRRLQRFSHQGLQPEKAEAYVNAIVTQTLELLASSLAARRIKLDARLDPQLDPPRNRERRDSIHVDAGQIQQVLMNLIVNAIAASPERGRIAIETKSHPDFVEIRVADHGLGISPENRRHLFTPFFTTKKDGVGLGLYLCWILVVDNHGGSLEILSSSPGKGTVFAVLLPRIG